MTDVRYRAAERAWQADPCPETQRVYLRERDRVFESYPLRKTGPRAEDMHDLRPGERVYCRLFVGDPSLPVRVLRPTRQFPGRSRQHYRVVLDRKAADLPGAAAYSTQWAGWISRDPNAFLAERAAYWVGCLLKALGIDLPKSVTISGRPIEITELQNFQVRVATTFEPTVDLFVTTELEGTLLRGITGE